MSAPASTAILTAQKVLDLPSGCISQGEAGFVTALGNLATLSKSKEQRTVMTAVADTLLAGTGHQRRASDRDLWFYQHGAGESCPDLTLVSEADNRVLAVIEAKLNAHPQATTWTTFAAASTFANDPLAHRAKKLRPRIMSPHPLTVGCGCSWHTARDKDGNVRAAVAQIDSYRLTRTWVDKTPDIVLDKPGKVAWLVLDRGGRPLNKLFAGAASLTAWRAASMADLATTIADLHATCREPETLHALRAVAFHLLN